VPYAIAHPAAAIPLHRLLGRHSVPSALVIGSIIPDAWYFVPFLGRADTHRADGLLYCLPLGLLVYLLFHLLLKRPLLDLAPLGVAARLREWACAGLPRVPWIAVLASLVVGVLAHQAWDAFTHKGMLTRAWPALNATVLERPGYGITVYVLLQHLSTLAGTAYLAWWLRTRLAGAASLHEWRWPRAPIALLLLALPLVVFAACAAASAPGASLPELRSLIRAAAVHAAAVFALALIAYCAVVEIATPQ
jgi:hypothetical protein